MRRKRVNQPLTLKETPAGRMRVEGKHRTFMVPPYLDGVCVASDARRAVAYLFDTGIIGGILLLSVIIFTRAFLGAVMWITDGDLSESVNELLVPLLCWVAVAVLNLSLVALRGQSIGRWLARTRVVRYDDGRQAGVRALAKVVLTGVIIGLPLCLGLVIDVYFTLNMANSPFVFPMCTLIGGAIGLGAFSWTTLKTQNRTNRHWIDRACGVMTIDLREGRDSAASAAEDAVSAERPAGAGRPAGAERPTDAEQSVDAEQSAEVEKAVPASPPDEVESREMRSDEQESPDDDAIVVPQQDPMTLVFDDGTSYVLEQAVVVGRNPCCDDDHREATRLQIVDPSMSVSKTHMALAPKAGAVLVEDLHSTNGTYVTTADGHTSSVLPGRCLIVGHGSTIYFGDRVVQVGE